jgi:ribosomal protein L24E
MWIIGRARAVCQRRIESGKSLPQVRKDSITAGCLFTASEKCPKSAMSPVSETPK